MHFFDKILNPDERLQRFNQILSSQWNALLLLTVVAFISYWPALQSDFIGDDIERVVQAQKILSGSLIDLVLQYKTDRPVTMATIWFNYQISGLNPFAFKLTNLFIHVLSVWSGLLFFRKLVGKYGATATVTFVAATIFIVHPLNNLAVQSIVQRGTSLAALFAILSLSQFIDFQERRLSQNYLLSVFFFTLAVLSKPTAAVIPLGMLVYLYHIGERNILRILQQVGVFFVYWLIPLLLYLPSASSQGDIKFNAGTYFLIQTKVFFIYIGKILWPVPLEYIHPIHNSFAATASDHYSFYLLAFVAIGILLIGLYVKKRTVLLLCLVMAAIFYLPQSSFFPIAHLLFYHRLYLSLFFVLMALCLWIANMRIAQKIKLPLACLAIGYFSILNLNYNVQVRNYNDWLWYNVKANPQHPQFNIKTLFYLKETGASVSDLLKFSDYMALHNPDDLELQSVRKIVFFEIGDESLRKKTVVEVTGYLSREQVSSSYFKGAIVFLGRELPQYFGQEKALLALNSIYFAHLNSQQSLWREARWQEAFKQNFRDVVKFSESQPTTTEFEQTVFFGLRSRIVLNRIFNEYQELDVQHALQLLRTTYRMYPESVWLSQQLSSLNTSTEKSPAH